jgi:hypothetical protein
MRGPATAIRRSSGMRRLICGTLYMIRSSRRRPTAVPPTAATTTRSPSAKPRRSRSAARSACCVGFEVLDIAGEREVCLRPFVDAGQLGTKCVRVVVRVANEERPIPHVAKTLDLLDHFRVVTGGQPFVFGLQPADEVRRPDVRRRLQLRVSCR